MSENIYQEFGGSADAITSDGSLTEHEKAMLEMDVSARDGDDAIELSEEDEFSIEEEQSDDEQSSETPEITTNKEEATSLESASNDLKEGVDGLQSMIDVAVVNGLPQDTVQSIMQEYIDTQKLSENSLKQLEEHGFSRKFVNNYIAGQQAMVERMAQGLVNFVGGSDNWEAITDYLEKNDTDTLYSLQEALDSNNIRQVKTILTLTQKTINSTKTEKFGTKSNRSITKSAKPQIQTQTNTVKGFTSTQEMVDAMSDKRYSRDPKYRSEVEAKVLRSNF
ncbi:capsid assembly protein [Yersinia enterocolitica]|uniref:capsid assembly protein n=1 Tax=Yersinia enterocolitica TaxID=630 RepID=UPI003D7980B2